MRAESERHLEDYLCHFPELIVPDLTVIARQFHVPSGIIDILGFTPDGKLWVIELKKDQLDHSALLQVCRYAADIEAIANEIWSDITGLGSESRWTEPRRNGFVQRVLVGFDIDRETHNIAYTLGIHVLMYGCSVNITHMPHSRYDRNHLSAISVDNRLDEYRAVVKSIANRFSNEQKNEAVQDG